ncbi:unnamed protein product [Blepharisma stoltei]|uniref:protein-tyrosine-phosphatase n=1 Tax=Blepharisma stoltei TaxID=1481888 RepID=A0AAU9JNP8_9CILI|nr:unnamed protein product [Blepharisma stoltei]
MLGVLDTFSPVSTGIFVGNSSAAKNINLLKENKITHILTCCKEIDPIYPNDFIYKKLDITDTIDSEISVYFEEAIEFIDSAIDNKGSILVHCIMGQSRSTTIVIAYLMKKKGISAKKALAFLKQKHRDTMPNAGFINQLSKYERKLREIRGQSKISAFCSNCEIY